ncbi:glycosyltransferase involved in cell wall biosynthesis [Bacillus ectoiniformans]|uniref:glycosyltransferase n=1 Tax=Bacillus ectoiniformans TaxID=1494429 RepID=UPI001958BBED|nr:glycosyltransferase [Bacillus ectoiniformans]MBM7650043.1 glycosyltransferase involved in cell wall biosynthesis [Bacillus ectoiniformans]
MIDHSVPVILKPSLPFRMFQTLPPHEKDHYFSMVLNEYVSLIEALGQLTEGQKVGVVLSPLFLKWFQTQSFQKKADQYFSQNSKPNQESNQLYKEWKRWNGCLIDAFQFYIDQGRCLVIPQAISDIPLTVLQSELSVKLQLKKTIEAFTSCFSAPCESIWLPRGAYTSGVDLLFKECKLIYIYIEETMLPLNEFDEPAVFQTYHGMKIYPFQHANAFEKLKSLKKNLPIFIQIPEEPAEWYRTLPGLAEKGKEAAAGAAQLTHIPFSYIDMNHSRLVTDCMLDQVTEWVEMERKIAYLKDTLPAKEQFLTDALIQEWIHFLYAANQQFPDEERMNFHSAFSYIYEGVMEDLCDYDFISMRNQLLMVNDAGEVSKKEKGSHISMQPKEGILMLSWEYPPRIVGGLSRHVHDLAKALVNAGKNVYIVTAAHEGAPSFENDEGVFVYRTGPLHPGEPDFMKWVADLNACLLRKAAELIEMKNIQLLHAHDWLVSHAAITCKELFDIPLVTTIHATEYGRNNGIFTDIQRQISSKEKELIHCSDSLIVCSQHMKEEVQAYYLEEEKPLTVIANGILLKEAEAYENKSSYHLRKYKPFIFSIGRMVKEKGFQVLIEAAPSLIEKYNIQIVIAGKGPLLDFFRAQVKEKGLEHSIHFIGFISDGARWELFKECEAAVFPSLYEPFGIVALEAMATKTPVIASETGGLKSFVIHEDTGLLCMPGEAESLKHQLERLILSSQLKGELGLNGYLMAKSLYSWERISELTQKVYDQTILNKKMEGVRQ